MNHWTKYFIDKGACSDALEFAKGIETGEEFWQTCKRADWMLWGLARIKHDPKTFRLACCACAEYSLKIYEGIYPNDRRPRNAIEVARRYANGDATIDELNSAAEAAWAARAAAWAAEDARAARAAAEAAWAAAWAARAAEEAAAAAAWAAAVATEWSALSDMADLIRAIIPIPPEINGEEIVEGQE